MILELDKINKMETVVTRRSTRTRRPPDRFGDTSPT